VTTKDFLVQETSDARGKTILLNLALASIGSHQGFTPRLNSPPPVLNNGGLFIRGARTYFAQPYWAVA
jgi:hypothetical protein